MKYISKFLIRWASLLCLLLGYSLSSEAQTVHISHCLGPCPDFESPVAANTAEIVVRHLFAAGINAETGLAAWVAYRVQNDAIGVASLLPRVWQEDDLIKGQPLPEISDLDLGDYIRPDNSNTQDGAYGLNEVVLNADDRVRLAPMASFAATPYWSDLNLMSNMSPMPTSLRVGPWSRLDQALNELSRNHDDLYVISGPLYLIEQALGSSRAISNQAAAYFKVIANSSGHVAFVFPANLRQHESFCEQQASLAEIEQLSGLHLYPDKNLSVSTELIAGLRC